MCKHIKTRRTNVCLHEVAWVIQVTCLKCGRQWIENNPKVSNRWGATSPITLQEARNRRLMKPKR